MDKLKLYAVPLVALVLILIWFLMIQPALDEAEQEPADAKADKKAQ
jgi:hypothetical protein